VDAMPVYALLALVVVLTSVGQVLQKFVVDRHAAGLEGHALVMRLSRTPELWLAIACLGVAMLFWLRVLHSMEVSKAFPFLGLGQVAVLLSARCFFHEHIALRRWVGALLIFAGIILVAGT